MFTTSDKVHFNLAMNAFFIILSFQVKQFFTFLLNKKIPSRHAYGHVNNNVCFLCINLQCDSAILRRTERVTFNVTQLKTTNQNCCYVM